MIVSRGNDLSEFFWPLLEFIKTEVIKGNGLPLWNPYLLSGTPLLPEPQSMLFYLPNYLFFVFPLKAGIVLSIVAHVIIGGIGVYYLSRKLLSFTVFGSLIAAILYVLSPRLFAFIEAGHYGLIASWAWLPFVVISSIKICSTPKKRWSVMLALFLAAIYFSHLPTALLMSTTSLLIIVFCKKRNVIKSMMHFIAAGFITIGLTAIVLLPQLSWGGKTTRFLLLRNPDTYPKWKSVWEYFIAISGSMWSPENIISLGTEKLISFGLSASFLIVGSFFYLRRKYVIWLVILFILVTLLSLNNASPAYDFLISQKWFRLLRVTTRVWPVVTFLDVLLCGFIVTRAKKIRNFVVVLAIVAVVESMAISVIYLSKPVDRSRITVSGKILDFLEENSDGYRVFCTSRCIRQIDAIDREIRLVEGYNTVVQQNFNSQAWQLSGSYWDYYSLAIPPIGSYKYEKPMPDSVGLGEYNTKYVLSQWEIDDTNLELIESVDGFNVYKNRKALSRAYYFSTSKEVKINEWKPNEITFDVSGASDNRIVVSQVFNSGWRAFSGDEELSVQEMPNALTLIEFPVSASEVEFIYKPKTYVLGRIISLTTVLVIIGSFLVGIKQN